jgi:hypothetical protein
VNTQPQPAKTDGPPKRAVWLERYCRSGIST